MRIMGLDVGVKRIGIALSDSMAMIAGGHSVLERSQLKRDLEHLKNLCQEQEVSRIVVGLPRNMNGTIGPKALEIQEFAAVLSAHTGIDVVFWDERLTTVIAQRVLIEADVSRRKRKAVVDKVAAVTILQNYLDSTCAR